jgi:hypothetical protein
MLASGTAAVLSARAAPALAAFPVASNHDNDARLVSLAGQYRRAEAAVFRWIERAERGHGMICYRTPRYRALCDRADMLFAELARTRPDSIAGLAVKLRAGIFYDSANEIPQDCDGRLLAPVLDDLDRLAETAGTP